VASGPARVVLGTFGIDPFLYAGINPSAAVPSVPDPTLGQISGFAVAPGCDSWMMLDVYAQIATNPKNFDPTCRSELKSKNESHIDRIFDSRVC
jgi:hypothetical protein